MDNILDAFQNHARIHPQGLAIMDEAGALTYEQLDILTAQFASLLLSEAPGFAAVYVTRTKNILVGALAALRAGLAYMPVDDQYPLLRIDYMLKDAACGVILTERCLWEEKHPENFTGTVIFLDEEPTCTPDCVNWQVLNEIAAARQEGDNAILLYTSGTTGNPKGVVHTHGSLTAIVKTIQYGSIPVDNQSHVAVFGGFTFIASAHFLFAPLYYGGTACIVWDELRQDADKLFRYLRENNITHTFLPPSLGTIMAEHYDLRGIQLMFAGEKLRPFTPLYPVNLFNAYGSTEGVIVTCHNVTETACDIPIGKPCPGIEIRLADENGQDVSTGEIGELWYSGPIQAKEYWHLPEQTAAKWLMQDGKRWFRTGDRVRQNTQGELCYIGRADDMVKLHGFRIELTEVEAIIRDFPGIKEAAAAAFDDPSGGKFLAAYVVSDSTVDVNALNAFIQENKPPYMVPAVTVQLDKLPRNQNQKVNKKALPKPELTTAAPSDSKTAAPLNRLEKELAEIVSEVVGMPVDCVSVPLRNLGLSSISSIRLATLIFKKYQISLNTRDLVDGMTLQDIENSILDTWMAPAETQAVSQSPKEEQRTACRLSFSQQGVYAECQAQPDSIRYNLPVSLKLPAGTKAETLKAAIQAVVSAHPSMCSRFTANEQNEILQQQVPDFVPEIPVCSMTQQEFADRKAAFARPFDLQAEVPMRFEIVEVEALYLLMDMHHLISDGASIDLFISQLCEALDGKPVEQEVYSYFDYAAGECIRDADDAFFAERMAVTEDASRLIPDIFEEGLPHTEGNVQIPTDLQAVSQLASRMGITPAAVYLAAVQLTVSRYLYEDTAAIATISNGRSNLKIHNTMGMFVNTLPLTAQVDSKQTAADFLRDTAQVFADTIAHEHYPFARIASRFGFQPAISYAYQVGVLQSYRTALGELEMQELSLGEAKLPVSVFIEGTENSGAIRIAYDESLYTPHMMTLFAQSIENVVKELAVQKALGDISLTDENQWTILDSFNRPFDLQYDADGTAVSAFRKNAAAQPDKVAAVYQDKQYTYRELDVLTDGLSKVIYDRISKTTGKTSLAECVVSILCGRNENAFILPLAVLKAGCAYEPLDPSYPQERLNFMIQDAGAVLLLAQDELRSLLDAYTGDTMLFSELYAAKLPDVQPVEPKPEDLFIMLYTSGSTGMPKGVQLEHRNLTAYAHGTGLEGFYNREATVAAFASFGFDVNMADTFCTLLNGGTLHLIPEEIRMNLGQLAAYFDENGITSILMTTQVGVQFLQNFPQLKTLKFLAMGGEKLPAVSPDALSYTIINGYGPTENCCGVSLFPIHAWEPNIPIGKPMRTIHGYILDKTGHRLPAGAAGEYCLSGPQVSRGYLNRPDKTAEAYAQCPFNEYQMYHTGDVVRYRNTGDVEFVGRKDGQVKIRGFRIETKEVEAVIREFDGVKDVTVQPYDLEGGGKYLAAFIVYDGTLDIAALTAFIKSRKPAYMVPAAMMQLERIPLTVNQKVDKKALPKPQMQKAAYVAPRGKAEEDFCRIFEEVLGLEKVSAEDDFFEIGGSSIIAMKVVIAAEKAGYEIVYQDVFNHTTPRALAVFTGAETPTEEAAAEAVPGTCVIVDKTGYDYSEIHALLEKNTVDAFLSNSRQEVGTVLLTGSTGFLGSHVLKALLADTNRRVYALVRPGKKQSAEARLFDCMTYYHGADFAALAEKRVTVLSGDATERAVLDAFHETGLTVINCAACVKHFSKTDEIEKTNIASVNQLIAWCLAHDSRLVHISTESVMGEAVGNLPPVGYRFTEHVLFAGQKVDGNQYIYSKFMAERNIYEAILKQGLNAKVIRVGNLAPRFSDGHFQPNYATNSFMKNLAAYQALGVLPYGAMDGIVEFSPIDLVAKSVLLLASTPRDCTCFMSSNNRLIHFGDIVMAFADADHPIVMAEGADFGAVLQKAVENPEIAETVSALMAYSHGKNSTVRTLGPESLNTDLTNQILYRLGFIWPVTGKDYIERFAAPLREKGFFR